MACNVLSARRKLCSRIGHITGARDPTLVKDAVFSGQQPLLVNAVVRLYGDAFNIGFDFSDLGPLFSVYLWLKSRYIPKSLAAFG